MSDYWWRLSPDARKDWIGLGVGLVWLLTDLFFAWAFPNVEKFILSLIGFVWVYWFLHKQVKKTKAFRDLTR